MLFSHTLLVFASSAMALGCTPARTELAVAPLPQSGDITSMSDEFGDSKSLSNWLRVEKTEGWKADQLQSIEVKQGWLQMIPYTSTWYRDYRGILVYKDVIGDFVVTTRLNVSNRDQNGPPRSQFSLAGIMVRTPRETDVRDWREGGENYVFLSLGGADRPGTYQFEVKTTVNSDSQLRTEAASQETAAKGTATIQIARIGSTMIMLKKDGANWSVHQRYTRSDFPKALQVGLTCYTDYPGASQMGARQHNGTTIKGGRPDLIASYDYVHYRKPKVPDNLAGRSLADSRSVSDADLLRFLGDNAN